jgi:hypothetical protein
MRGVELITMERCMGGVWAVSILVWCRLPSDPPFWTSFGFYPGSRPGLGAASTRLVDAVDVPLLRCLVWSGEVAVYPLWVLIALTIDLFRLCMWRLVA